jgi:hypothetical protein
MLFPGGTMQIPNVAAMGMHGQLYLVNAVSIKNTCCWYGDTWYSEG